jgi:hypothetical protein
MGTKLRCFVTSVARRVYSAFICLFVCLFVYDAVLLFAVTFSHNVASVVTSAVLRIAWTVPVACCV